MKVLITGAGGFLGKEIVRQMTTDAKMQIIALTSQEEELRHIGGDSEIKIIGRDAVFNEEDCFADVDALINCAFPRNADGVQLAKGLLYISRVLEKAVAGGVKSVINISSQSVYSQIRSTTADETAELCLETRYAVGKYATELLTNSICKNIPHTNIRLASLIGAGFDQRLVNKFVKQVLAGKDLYIKGGKQQFGFLDVRDAAAAIILVAKGDHWEEAYNLGSENCYTILEIAECVQKTLEKRDIARTQIILEETDDWQNSSLDGSKLRQQFEWEEKFGLEDAILSISGKM